MVPVIISTIFYFISDFNFIVLTEFVSALMQAEGRTSGGRYGMRSIPLQAIAGRAVDEPVGGTAIIDHAGCKGQRLLP